MNGLVTVMIWVHVATASWWVLTSVTMAVVGAVLNADSVEGRDFIVLVVPKLNWANNAAAAIVLITGLVNLYGAGRIRSFNFPPSFGHVLAVKLVLYAIMFATLRCSVSVGRRLIVKGSNNTELGYLAGLSAITAMVGATAMLFGLWLAGE